MALTKISTGGVKDDTADESKLKVSNAGTNGQFLQKQSGNNGGLTWADAITAIADDSITQAKIADDAIGQDQLADNAVVLANLTNDCVTADKIADEAIAESRLEISNAGTNGQFLQKQSGNTGGLTWADIPAGGNSIDQVADGAIAAGKPVVLTTAGKVEVVKASTSNITNPSSLSVANVQNFLGYSMAGIWHETTGKGYIAYTKTTGGANQTRHRQFRLAGNGGITFMDTEVGLDSEKSSNIKIILDPDVDKPVTFWRREGDDNYVRSRVINIDGNGSNHVQASTAGESIPRSQAMYDYGWDVCYDTNANIFVYVYEDDNDSRKGKVRLGYQSEPSSGQHKITWINTDVEFSSNCRQPRCEFDTVNNKVIIAWSQAGSDISACIGTVSNSGSSATISVGSRVVVNSTGAAGKPVMAWNTTDGVAGFLYRRTDNNQNHLITLKTSGTTVHYNSSVRVGNEDRDKMALWYVSSTGNFSWAVMGRVGWISSTGTPTSGGSGSSTATVGSGAVDVSNAVGAGNVNDYEPIDGLDLPDHSFATGVLTSNTSDSSRLKVLTLTIAGALSNATSATKLIGFAESAISDGNTGTIKLHGNVVGNQSSLTIGELYYIQGDGTLGTNGDNTIGNVKAGTAVSATKLIICDPRV